MPLNRVFHEVLAMMSVRYIHVHSNIACKNPKMETIQIPSIMNKQKRHIHTKEGNFEMPIIEESLGHCAK